MLLESLAQAAQDLDGLLDRGFAHRDRLEATLQGGVTLDVLAVFVKRGGADRLHLAARKRGLQDIGGIDRAFGRARADDGMQLVDEEDAVAGGPDLLDDLLEPLFELAAIFRAGDQRADIEREQSLAQQILGHLAADDPLRQALDNRGLADARLADERRIVLAAA